ncbi:MAG: hypothetical protein HRF44_06815 [Ignavibacterium sp.]
MNVSFKPVAYDPQNPHNLGINTPYKGVFLNENPAFDPQRPSYWVKAPFTKLINGFTSYRQSLTATGASFENASAESTRVVFTSANGVVTATYKAHRGSSVSTATGANGQRKLISDAPASLYDLVYESAGEIWWTRYDNSLNVVVAETRISTGAGNCSYPSLARIGTNLYAVWQRYNPSTNLYRIEYAKYSPSSWTSPVDIGWAEYNASYNPAPVIAAYSQQRASTTFRSKWSGTSLLRPLPPTARIPAGAPGLDSRRSRETAC